MAASVGAARVRLDRHSRAEAAGGLSLLLGARRIDAEQPSELLPGGALNRPRAHRSIMLVYNFTNYFALLPLDFVDKLFDRRARLNSLRCEAL